MTQPGIERSSPGHWRTVNVIARFEIKLAYYNIAIQQVCKCISQSPKHMNEGRLEMVDNHYIPAGEV